MSNKSIGNKFEQELAQRLSEKGFWVHVLQQNKAGQPADIIAVCRDYATLIDCKVISGKNGFILNRVEENQSCAMKLFSDCTGNACWFALQLPDETVWMLPYHSVRLLKFQGRKSIPESQIRSELFTLDEWVHDIFMGDMEVYD